ncbi:MAG: hypothetical protein AAFX06_20765 [Planctomycetota bacterium]
MAKKTIKRKVAIVVVLLAVFAGGIAAERYRRDRATNVGSVSIGRSHDEIAVSIDGDPVTQWNTPFALRAGQHQLAGEWQGHEVAATIHVERDAPSYRNQFQFSLNNGQVSLQQNVHLMDIAPRPEAEVFAIQTASGKFWHADRQGRVTLRETKQLASADRFKVHWLRPDHGQAFIQASDGSFVTNRFRDPELLCGSKADSSQPAPPAVFTFHSRDAEDWVEVTIGENVIGSDTLYENIACTPHDAFALPHRFVDADNAKKPPPVPDELMVPVAASRSKSVRRLKGHTDVIRGVAFTPDEKHVVSGSLDGSIRFWDTQSGKQVGMIHPNRPVMSLAISSDGKFLVAGLTEAVVKLWSLQHGPRLTAVDERVLSRNYQGDVRAVSFSHDNTQVAAARQEVRIWNLLAPTERCRSTTRLGQITSLGWSRSGDHVLICADERSTTWWPKRRKGDFYDARAGKVLAHVGDRSLVLVGGDLIDPETSEVVFSYQPWPAVHPVSVQIAQHGGLMVTGDTPYSDKQDMMPDGLVTVWDLGTGSPLASLREPCGQVHHTVISSAGRFVAYGSGYADIAGHGWSKSTGDYDVRLWDLASVVNADN